MARRPCAVRAISRCATPIRRPSGHVSGRRSAGHWTQLLRLMPVSRCSRFTANRRENRATLPCSSDRRSLFRRKIQDGTRLHAGVLRPRNDGGHRALNNKEAWMDRVRSEWSRGRRGDRAMLVVLYCTVGLAHAAAGFAVRCAAPRGLGCLDQLSVCQAHDVPRGEQMHRSRQIAESQGSDAQCGEQPYERSLVPDGSHY